MQWESTEIELSKLKPYGKNPRRLTKKQKEQLQTSIEKYGLCEPIVINTDGTIIGGHGRYHILKSQKKKKAQVFRAAKTLTEDQVQELNIRLNKNTGEWDYDILANQWNLDSLLEWGFEPDDLSIDAAALDILNEKEEDKPKEESKCPNCGFSLG